MSRVIYMKYITREYVQSRPEYTFLFGDNTIRQGYGGQAKEMRGEPNAIGIVTKRFPSMELQSFFLDGDFEEAKRYIDADFNRIPKEGHVVVPYYGLGTGMARLQDFAPSIYEYIESKIKELEK